MVNHQKGYPPSQNLSSFLHLLVISNIKSKTLEREREIKNGFFLESIPRIKPMKERTRKPYLNDPGVISEIEECNAAVDPMKRHPPADPDAPSDVPRREVPAVGGSADPFERTFAGR